MFSFLYSSDKLSKITGQNTCFSQFKKSNRAHILANQITYRGFTDQTWLDTQPRFRFTLSYVLKTRFKFTSSGFSNNGLYSMLSMKLLVKIYLVVYAFITPACICITKVLLQPGRIIFIPSSDHFVDVFQY